MVRGRHVLVRGPKRVRLACSTALFTYPCITLSLALHLLPRGVFSRKKCMCVNVRCNSGYRTLQGATATAKNEEKERQIGVRGGGGGGGRGDYSPPGWAVATVCPVAALWETSMKPLAFLGSDILERLEW